MDDYWKLRGKIFKIKNPYSKLEYKQEETRLLGYLKTIKFKSVLEVGCGYGRITKLILDNFVIENYDAFDISDDLIKNCRNHFKQYKNINFFTSKIEDLNMNKKYDLVISTEVLQHIPQKNINSVINKMVELSNNHIINTDIFFKSNPTELSKHNFNHDYITLYKHNNMKNVTSILLDELNHYLFHAYSKT